MDIIGLIILIATIYWCWRLFHHKHYRGKQWWRHSWPAVILLLVSLNMIGSNSSSSPTVKTKTVTTTHLVTADNDSKLAKLQSANSESASSLKADAKSLAEQQSSTEKLKKQNQTDGATKTTATTEISNGSNPSNTALANQKYTTQQTITINNNQPAFSSDELKTDKGAWQTYGNLDQLNRVTTANALLSQSLMPKSERTALNVQPTGWHNKRIASGWLYNRSHLIGYQLTGQNNNIKNLVTGTRTLNDPEMTTYENQVADYLKASPKHYVRYQVNPVFKGNELLARGVQMRAQSIGNNDVSFNVYIFNIQPGMTLNYQDGTSTVSN
ncbi:DNA/RNA non-specific endonuclease [Lactiplantibacillus herbarum]|uniref:DNA/RNA non-specific endonuclease n=1 Tax=Lactiplantibacillus herbarum TaxID=1670446 RepID=UPI00064EFB68|nr:DNA/RNA non-specific endonuclease [Lactiplantibacillus herbarum]